MRKGEPDAKAVKRTVERGQWPPQRAGAPSGSEDGLAEPNFFVSTSSCALMSARRQMTAAEEEGLHESGDS
eukprot:5641505-Pleurochrysis_carterae.AAC.1